MIERTGELEQARLETLQRLALAAEYRDDDTHQHTERVGHASMLIARQLGLPDQMVQTIRDAAPLHDVGKLGVSDGLLLKPGELTAQEFQIMQQHTMVGAVILAGSSSCVLQMAEQIALTHHERWDGSGYPDGLAGEDIPLTARITALADAFDAMTHARPYKDAEPVDVVLAEIRRSSGTHFDPAVVTAFLTLDHVTLLHQTLSDREQTLSDLDQTLSDLDQTASARDQTASEQDEIASARDQDAREEAALPRGRAARARDASARARDQAADLRDRIADANAREQDRWSASRVNESADAEAVDYAARDRARAGADPESSARDRGRARQARHAAAHERTQTIAESTHAAHGRDWAVTDALTGARTRGAGLAELQREIDRARHTTGSLVLALIEIEQVDGSEGRPAGDRLLTAVASALRDGLRSYDLIMRHSGDEFLCALSGITIDEVQRRVAGLTTQLEARSNGYSISAGIAELRDGDDSRQLIARPHDALLQTRQAVGLDRVCPNK